MATGLGGSVLEDAQAGLTKVGSLMWKKNQEQNKCHNALRVYHNQTQRLPKQTSGTYRPWN